MNGGIGDRGIREGDREVVLAITPGVVEGEYGALAFLTVAMEEAEVGRERDLDPALDRDFGVEVPEISVDDVKGGLVGKKCWCIPVG